MLRLVYSKARDALLSLSWPQECRVCSRPVDSFDDGVACRACWSDPAITTLLLNLPVCEKCGRPVTEAVGTRCGRCDGFAFDAARSSGLYKGALKANILFLKSSPHLCPRLARSAIETFSANREALSCDVIIPVPLHPRRERERGFNQAEIIARLIASRFKIPLDLRSFARVLHTDRHRAGMDRIDRAKSVERAFEVRRPQRVQGSCVLIVDDIFTTGSTIEAAARTLIESGAARVAAMVLARVQ